MRRDVDIISYAAAEGVTPGTAEEEMKSRLHFLLGASPADRE